MSREKLVDCAWRVYGKPEVEAQCRDLQDTHYANVNLLLWLAWLQQQAIRLEKSALDAAIDLIGPVSGDVVSLLRHVRGQVKALGRFTKVQEQLILKNILQAEITVEKILLERLQDMTGRMPRITESGLPPLHLVDYLDMLRVPGADQLAQGFMLTLAQPPLVVAEV